MSSNAILKPELCSAGICEGPIQNDDEADKSTVQGANGPKW